MVGFTSVRADISKERLDLYKDSLISMNLRELVNEFFTYLDYVEETDSGREFNPITIGCCRILMSQPLDACLKQLRLEAS